jgi:tetratricopeptide (TPR) repeat protein
VTEDDELHYLTVVQGKSGPTSVLRHMTLAAAREFAAGEAETKPRDQKTWQAIVVEVLGSSSSEGKSNQPALTPARAARTADDFAKAYKDHFKAEAPASLQQLERLRLELAGFHWSAERQADCALVLGVVEGEFLVRHHGARWSLSKSPRIDGPSIAEEGEHENPFTIMVNPFAAAGAWLRAAKEAVNLSRILHQAGGRTIVLANDLSAVQPAIAGLSDPDLASAEKLFRDGAAEKAEALLVKMLEKKQYAGNHVLVIHAASLLERYGRTKVFRQVIEKECEAPFHDARRYNLLGIARLQEDPRGAVDAFSYALRCDLRFDAGYLNLALAYDRAGEPVKAQACLRRYLSMKPGGKYAADALRRLTAWGNRSAN